MPFLPASLSWAPIITMGSRPGGPTTDLPTVSMRPLQPASGAVMAAPRAMPGLVMPGVRRTPGRPRGGDRCPGWTPWLRLASAPPLSARAMALRAFLVALELPQYEECVLALGFDDVAAYATFDNEDVEAMERGKTAPRRTCFVFVNGFAPERQDSEGIQRQTKLPKVDEI